MPLMFSKRDVVAKMNELAQYVGVQTWVGIPSTIKALPAFDDFNKQTMVIREAFEAEQLPTEQEVADLIRLHGEAKAAFDEYKASHKA